uniref:Uncharacterized protein n=1 Tax=Caenorhabditis japonica TaxID=281687 RepID=A0A8R1IS72_CAEJA
MPHQDNYRDHTPRYGRFSDAHPRRGLFIGFMLLAVLRRFGTHTRSGVHCDCPRTRSPTPGRLLGLVGSGRLSDQ